VSYDRSIRLFTERLVLRATVPTDIERAVEIRSNTRFARNLASATIPPDVEKMTHWFAGHAEEWRQGAAYRLAITLIRWRSVARHFSFAGWWREPIGRGLHNWRRCVENLAAIA
jgi:RimJ/RimL family protein N-acetyltransferase